MRVVAAMIGILFLLPGHIRGQDVSELLARMKSMEARIQTLEAEVRALRGKPEAPAPLTASTDPQVRSAEPLPGVQLAPGPQLPYYGGQAAAAKIFNPDLSVIGTFLGAAGNPRVRPGPSFQMRETEVALQAIVDPYARADFFLSFGHQGVELEEGYLTFPALPGGFQAKAGKMRAAFGRVNTMHLDTLPWTDRPLVTQNLLGGEEGISDAGLAVSRILPAPGGVFLEGAGQFYRLFGSERRSDVLAVGRLRGFRDVSESTNVDLGFSFGHGSSPEVPSPALRLYGMDATVRWKPLRRAIYRSFIGRTELVWARAAQPEETARAFGYYVSGEYQFGRRWSAGARFDRSERYERLLRDTGGSLLLTYRPSEFSQLRGQLRRTRYGERVTANELLFQLQFSLGVHGAHPF